MKTTIQTVDVVGVLHETLVEFTELSFSFLAVLVEPGVSCDTFGVEGYATLSKEDLNRLGELEIDLLHIHEGEKGMKVYFPHRDTFVYCELLGRTQVEAVATRNAFSDGAQVGGNHYKQGKGISPWDLQRHMESTGDAFLDARRADIIRYVFRTKDDWMEQLKKAKHCIDAAIIHLESKTNKSVAE